MGERNEGKVPVSREIEDTRRDLEMKLLQAIAREIDLSEERVVSRPERVEALAAALGAVQAPMVARMGVDRGR